MCCLLFGILAILPVQSNCISAEPSVYRTPCAFIGRIVRGHIRSQAEMFLYGYAEMIVFAAGGLSSPRFNCIVTQPIAPEKPGMADHVHFDCIINRIKPSDLRLFIPRAIYENDAERAEKALMRFDCLKAVFQPSRPRYGIVVEYADIFGLEFVAEQESGPNTPVTICRPDM